MLDIHKGNLNETLSDDASQKGRNKDPNIYFKDKGLLAQEEFNFDES